MNGILASIILGILFGLFILFIFYTIIKNAVKNGALEAYQLIKSEEQGEQHETGTHDNE